MGMSKGRISSRTSGSHTCDLPHPLEEGTLGRRVDPPVHGWRLEAITVVVGTMIIVAPRSIALEGGVQTGHFRACLIEDDGLRLSAVGLHVADPLNQPPVTLG